MPNLVNVKAQKEGLHAFSFLFCFFKQKLTASIGQAHEALILEQGHLIYLAMDFELITPNCCMHVYV